MSSVVQYASILKNLLPSGRAWNKYSDSIFNNFLMGLAEEMLRADQSFEKLITESDPRTATDMLQEWENLVGIPDECQDVSSSIGQRRLDITRKYTARGGQNADYFKKLAADFGYDVTISEYQLFRAGKGRAGDAIYDESWTFYWQVFSSDVTPVFFEAGGSSAGDPLRLFRNDILECVIRRAAPAHTHPIFTYGG